MDNDHYQYITFGNIVKAASFEGGSYFAAPWNGVGPNEGNALDIPTIRIQNEISTTNTSTGGSLIFPFAGGISAGGPNNTFGGWAIHAEIAGIEWVCGGEIASYYPTSDRSTATHQHLYEIRSVSTNSINGNSTLIPFRIYAQVENGNYQKVGHLKHAMFALMQNIEPEQVESDGTDDWKFYPILTRDRTSSVGTASGKTSGLYALAIKYDGA
jgi:hypothetical protein